MCSTCTTVLVGFGVMMSPPYGGRPVDCMFARRKVLHYFTYMYYFHFFLCPSLIFLIFLPSCSPPSGSEVLTVANQPHGVFRLRVGVGSNPPAWMHTRITHPHISLHPSVSLPVMNGDDLVQPADTPTHERVAIVSLAISLSLCLSLSLSLCVSGSVRWICLGVHGCHLDRSSDDAVGVGWHMMCRYDKMRRGRDILTLKGRGERVHTCILKANAAISDK